MNSLQFEVGPHKYRAGKLDAKRQLHVMRRLAPLVMPLIKSGAIAQAATGKKSAEGKDQLGHMSNLDLLGMAEAVTQGLSTLPDADLDFVVDTCLSVVEREQTGGGWARMMTGDQLQFVDLDMVSMLSITWRVIQHNLSGFFATLPQGFGGQSPT